MNASCFSRIFILLATVPLCWVGNFYSNYRPVRLNQELVEVQDTILFSPCVKLLPDPDRVYHGLYNVGDVAVGYGEMEAKSGNQPVGIVTAFHNWNGAGIEAKTPLLKSLVDPMEGDDVTPLWMMERAARDGNIVALVWDAIGYIVEHPDYNQGGVTTPITFDDIFDGVYDDYIQQVAIEIREFGHPVMLSPAAEFNAIGYASFGPDANEPVTAVDPAQRNNQYGDPTLPDGPERVRDLYRYVIDIFNAQGVRNVTWFMYSHSAYLNPDDLDPDELATLDSLLPEFYYPGDDYIDWIGNSAYISTEDPELDLEFAVSHAIEAFDRITNKPFFIPEFGITTNTNENRAAKIVDVFVNQLPAFPQIRAFTFADADLFEAAFSTPRLGNYLEEIDAWREYVTDSEDYTNDLNIKRVRFSQAN